MRRALAWLGPPPPSAWVALGLQAAAGGALCFVPLFDLLGYEFAAALALLASLTAGPVALALGRRARGEWARVAVLPVYLRALAWLGLSLAAPLALISLNALRVPNCNWLDGWLFVLLLPFAGGAAAAAWGLALGLCIRRRWLGGLAYAGVWLGLAGLAVWRVWTGPEVDSWNPLVGWVAGPVYEEVVRPGWALAWSRLHDLAWALGPLAVVAGLRGLHPQRAFLAGAALLALAFGLGREADGLGFGRSTAAVERALPEELRTAHFRLRHAVGLEPERARLLARDCEFRLHQLLAALGPVELPPLTVYLFPDAQTKRRWTGAGHTQYVKPWLNLLVLNAADFPHPTLKHELVHAVAAAFGSWPIRASARGALWVNPGLTEGIAVALDWPVGALDPHTWSAAMRRLGKAPDVRALFGPVGFWSAAANRSYTLAGSFVRYLLERHGPAALRQAYAQGSLEGAYPGTLDGLIQGWEAHLDALPVPPAALESARARFAQGSVFQRACAHEVAGLRAAAGRALARDPARAGALAEELLGHLPGDPQALELQLEARAGAGAPAEARALALALLARADLLEADRTRLTVRLAELELELGLPAQARDRLQAVLSNPATAEEAVRASAIRLEALERGLAGQRVLAFLARGKTDALALLELRQATLEQPAWGAAWYLLGRALWNLGEPARALPCLRRALDEGLLHPALLAEDLRLVIQAAYRTGNGDGGGPAAVATAALTLMQFPRFPGDLALALDWLERLAFDASQPLEAP
ncbi:MAG TPA: hypothetical protein PK668_21180 [Myxococcota bacterium]|nr:hypothetical protein [Myxococcota bacterium]HRY95989.1 hypothetical protein [Myxococcota bacterium]